MGYQAAGVAVVALSALPVARSLFGVSPTDAATGIAAVLGTNLLATAAYHARGETSLAYRLIALTEMLTYQTALMWLIYRSGSGSSFLWLLWMGQAASNIGITEHHRGLMVIYGATPLTLGACFLLLRGDMASAIACFIGFLVGGLVFGTGLRLNMKLAQAIAEREAAQNELSELRLREERQRIARDLHDGVTADLVAVAMRADWVHHAPADRKERELREIALRAREAIDDLRAVVWSMRSPERAPADLAAYVEQRCRELCTQGVAFEIEARVEAAAPIEGARALELVRIAQECCRNAVRHAAPSRISVKLTVGEVLSLTVDDDGRGLPEGVEERCEGGLANLKTRATRCGGAFTLTRLERGTRVEVSLPGG